MNLRVVLTLSLERILCFCCVGFWYAGVEVGVGSGKQWNVMCQNDCWKVLKPIIETRNH